MMMEILRNITIIDFTRLLPGPLATNWLAQMGAEVIKIEHPEKGDPTRMQPPLVNGESTLFTALNFAKTIRTIDFLSSQGLEEVKELVRQADILIEQFRPGVMETWGLGYEALRSVNQKLIYISLSGYGQKGPYAMLAGHDLNYLAYSGMLSLMVEGSGKPVIPGAQIADVGSGSYLTLSACLGALLHRERTGAGSRVDVSMLNGVLPMMTVAASQVWGEMDPYAINFLSGALVNYNVYECADGKWVALGALELKFWSNFCDWAQKPGWERQNHFELSVRIFPKTEVEAFFKSKTQAEWIAKAAGYDICLTPVRRIEEIGQDPHISETGPVIEIQTRKGAAFHSFGLPFQMR